METSGSVIRGVCLAFAAVTFNFTVAAPVPPGPVLELSDGDLTLGFSAKGASLVKGKAQWQNEENLKAMTGTKKTVTITKADSSTVKAENTIECVRDYNQRKCPSFFKREFLHQMFNKPA